MFTCNLTLEARFTEVHLSLLPDSLFLVQLLVATMNQSGLEANLCKRCKAREKEQLVSSAKKREGMGPESVIGCWFSSFIKFPNCKAKLKKAVHEEPLNGYTTLNSLLFYDLFIYLFYLFTSSKC